MRSIGHERSEKPLAGGVQVIEQRRLVSRLVLCLLGSTLTLCSASAEVVRTISFAGLTWDVRSGSGAPGNGCWSDDPESVWVDDSGLLHLKIRRLPDGRWCQAEVIARSYADYGPHCFRTNSRIDQLGDTTVLGLFLYADDQHEIDIEATRAFTEGENLLYAVQPYYKGAPRSSFGTMFQLNGQDHKSYSSHRLAWSEDRSVTFGSWHGHCEEPPCGGEIATWSYQGSNTPVNTWLLKPYINLWIKGDAPESPQEVVIREYSGPQVPRPTTTTAQESAVTSTAATLNGAVNPNGWSTTGWFEYGPSTSYAFSTEAGRQAVGSDTSDVSISKAIAELACSAVYHFRAVGSNVAGRAYGVDRTFKTGACPAPLIATASASRVGPTSVTLNATVNPNGATTTTSFEYGPTRSYGSSTYAENVDGSTGQGVSIVAAPLQCNTTYHFRARAANDGGTSYGADSTFTTEPCSEVPPRQRPVRP